MVDSALGRKSIEPLLSYCGVGQGGALSPCLFALFISIIIIKVITNGKGCHLGLTAVNITLYADDILLLARSITALQSLLFVCQDELLSLDMMINSKNLIVFVSVIRL